MSTVKKKTPVTKTARKSGHPLTRWLRATIKHLLFTVNMVFVLFHVFAMLSKWTPPDSFMWFSYFGLFYPIIFFVNVVFMVLWMVRKKRMWIVLCLLLLLSIRSNNDVFTIPFKKKPVLSAAPIKLLSYNISLFSGEKNYRQIVDFIFNTDADIVCLQEFGYYNHASKLSAAAIVSLFEQKYPYHHIWYKNQNRMASWGAATFSKHPIVHKHKIEYDSRFNISIYSDIILGGDTVRVMNNHLESNKLTMRDFKEYHNDNKDRSEFMNVSVMMSEKLGAAYIIRAKQARVVANEIQASPYPVVVCGDFNDVPTSYAYQTIKKGLIDAYTATGWGYRYTYYQNGMLVGIDHVLLDKHFAPVSCRIVHTGFSDHYPVIAEWVHKRQ